MDNTKETIRVKVADTLLHVTLERKYADLCQEAADYATERFNLYYETNKETKSEHNIILITLLDIVVMPFVPFSRKPMVTKATEFHIYDKTLRVKIRPELSSMYYDAAELVTEYYSSYSEKYKGEDCHTIDMMALFAVALNYKKYMNDDESYEWPEFFSRCKLLSDEMN